MLLRPVTIFCLCRWDRCQFSTCVVETSANFPPVLLRPEIIFNLCCWDRWQFSACVVDADGKFGTVNLRKDVTTGVKDTGGSCQCHFGKISNSATGIIRGWEKMINEKNLKSKISWLCPFKGVQAWDVCRQDFYWNQACFYVWGLILPFISWDFCFSTKGYSAKKIKKIGS